MPITCWFVFITGVRARPPRVPRRVRVEEVLAELGVRAGGRVQAVQAVPQLGRPGEPATGLPGALEPSPREEDPPGAHDPGGLGELEGGSGQGHGRRRRQRADQGGQRQDDPVVRGKVPYGQKLVRLIDR